jgi:glycosyltransferase involved in cell wall biosynthesis
VRVLSLTNLFPNPLQPNRGTFNRQQLRVLGQRHPVRIIAPIAWTDEWAARRNGKVLSPERRGHVDGLEVEYPRYVFPPRLLRGSYGRLYLRSVRDAFARAVCEFRPTVLYACWAYPDGWAAVELGRRTGLPVVVKVHGSDLLVLADQRGRRRGTRRALSGAAMVVAVSRDLRQRAIELGADPRRARVIYSGVDSSRFYPGPAAEARARLGIEPGAPVVLFVGNLVAVKGVVVLVEACARLARDGARFRAVLVGDGPMRPRLADQIRRLGLADWVLLYGAVPHLDLPDWFRAAAVCVLPSHSEGVPNVLLEAAACGAPFVASRVGGIPEIAHLGRSQLVPPGNADALARAVRRVLDRDPAERPPAATVRDHQEAVNELEEVLAAAVREGGQTPRPGGWLGRLTAAAGTR